MPPGFQDYYSKQAPDYLEHRPSYPSELFDHLRELVPAGTRVWDVCTGNGQAARSLGSCFAEVIATDASAQQIAVALPHPGVQYRVENAEQSTLPDNSVDLITVAAGLHWLRRDPFFDEVRRVLRPGGVLAAWTYAAEVVISPAVDREVAAITAGLGPWWPAAIKDVQTGYRDVSLPWPATPVNRFAIQTRWSLQQLVGHVQSWSGSQARAAALGAAFPPEQAQRLREAWGSAEAHPVRLPLYLRWCRRPGG